MLILAKIVQHSKKCQATDLIFFLLPSSMRILLCKNLHDHMLCIFTLFIFTRNQQLIKVKQEDHIPSIPTVGLAFFLARACQHKTSKIGMTIFALLQLKICIYKMETNLKALIQLNLIPIKNILNSRYHIFIKQYTS